MPNKIAALDATEEDKLLFSGVYLRKSLSKGKTMSDILKELQFSSDDIEYFTNFIESYKKTKNLSTDLEALKDMMKT